MLEYWFSSDGRRIWNTFIRAVTAANVAALCIWLSYCMMLQTIELMMWLRTLALTISITISGWLADHIWYRTVSVRVSRPFGLKAYATRLPFYFVLSAIFFTLTSLAVRLNPLDDALSLILAGGSIQLLYQIPVQWSTFNRIRKMSLLNL